ncbi:signal peptidase II, partial [Clavibacter michiganensis subsp. insidiosus]
DADADDEAVASPADAGSAPTDRA